MLRGLCVMVNYYMRHGVIYVNEAHLHGALYSLDAQEKNN